MLCSWALKIDNVALAECTSIKAVGTANQVPPLVVTKRYFALAGLLLVLVFYPGRCPGL